MAKILLANSGRRYALCVGIDKYFDTKIRSLRYAVDDAAATAQVFSDPARGNFEVTLLTSAEQTTREALLEELQHIVESPDLQPDDLVVIYFSCHGAVYGADKTFCLFPSDAAIEENGDVDGTTVIDVHDIAKTLFASNVKNIILLLDVCYSGRAGDVLQHLRQNLSPDNSIFILAAARPDQRVIQVSQLGHGVFTDALLRAFRQKPNRPDGWLTVTDVQSFVSEIIRAHPSFQQGRMGFFVSAHAINPNLPIVKNPHSSNEDGTAASGGSALEQEAPLFNDITQIASSTTEAKKPPRLESFSSYKILRLLNAGMTGYVYLARPLNGSKREVVLKIIRTDLKDDPFTRQCFAREAEISTYLKNEHVLPVIEFGEEKGRLFLVTPYIKGKSLDAKLKKGPLALAELRRIFTALVEAVSYLHKHEVIHGNLNTYSILLDKTEDRKGVYVRLTNLYMASMQGSSISPLPTMSPEGYDAAAPERLEGIIEPSSDIYSLGALLSQMVTGESPHTDETVSSTEPLEPLISVARRCLQDKPEDRYNSADELLRAFKIAAEMIRQPTVPLEPVGPSEAPITEEPQTLQEITAEEWFQKGIALLYEQKRYKEAILAFDQAIQLNLNHADTHFSKGFALNKLKQYDEAILAFDQAIRLNPDSANAYINKGFALLSLKRYEDVIQVCDQAIRLNPNSAGNYRNKGFALLNLKRYEEAIEIYSQAIQLNPNSADAYYNKGFALGNLQRHEEAIQAFDETVRLKPNSPKAHYNKGFALENLKRHEEAIQAYDQAIRLNPDSPNAYINKGIALGNLKRYEEAIQAYDQAIQLNPNSPNAYTNKGITLRNLKRYEEAIQAYDQAIRLNPNYTNAYYNKGSALRNLKRYVEAIQAYDQAIRLNPNYVPAYANTGYALNELRRYEEAIQIYDKAIRLNPNYTAAYTNKGCTLNELKRYEEAIFAFDQAIQLKPNSADAYCNKGIALENLKRYEEAIQALDQAIRLNPTDTDAHRHKDSALRNLKHYEGKTPLENATLIYSISVDISPKEVSIGGEVEVVLSLSLTNDNSAYQLEVPHNELSGSELNVLLTTPHFHINGENATSLALDLVNAQNVDTNRIRAQTARFSLTALRSGPVKLQLDLYVGDVFKTSLEYTVQVASIDQTAPFSIHDLTRPRPVRHPDLILQVHNDADTDNTTNTFHYHLTSPRTIMHIPEQGIEYRSSEFPAGWLERVYALLHHTLESTAGAQAADRRTRLVSFGQYLFRSLLPTELQRTLRSLVDIGHTLLILSDQESALPWTLLHDGNAFLGEHFSIGRWLRELHDTRAYEFPVGVVSIAYYEGITRPEIWAEALAPPGAPSALPLPGGMLHNVGTTETIRGLHLLRSGKSSRAIDLHDAPALLTQTPGESSIEQQVQVAKFSLRSNHPLVTLSYLHAGMSEITTLEQSWSSTFIRAGCSAFIGPLWAIHPTVEATFVSTFYARLWAGDALGEAFRAARELTRMVVPNSIDYLAYVLFGDPLARPYRPVEGDGYATVEPVGREMEDPVQPGTSVRFRVSLRRRPPIWHEGRVIEVAQALNFEHLKIYVVTFGLEVTPTTPITLMHTSTGDYFGWFSLSVPIDSKRITSTVQVHFVDGPDPGEAGTDEFDEPEPIHSLRFTLPIAGGDGNVR